MEKPDSNGFVNVYWPSKNVPHGGIFHAKVLQPSEGQQELLKVLLEESKLTAAQRRKSAYKLRENTETKEDVRPQNIRPTSFVRPRTSRRRSLSAIRVSEAFEADTYRPLKRGEDRERLKDMLAKNMQYGDSAEQPVEVTTTKIKALPKLPTEKQKWNDLVTQIRERADWLAEMEYLGEAGPHRDIINGQIAERMRALDALSIDSQCSTARSTASGFSTLRSTDNVPKIIKPTVGPDSGRSGFSCQSRLSIKNKKPIRSAAERVKEENVEAYDRLSPLQYSPRRRV